MRHSQIVRLKVQSVPARNFKKVAPTSVRGFTAKDEPRE